MKILITGTSGFIGRTLLAHLEAQGHEVLGTVRSREPNANEIKCDVTAENFADHMPNENFDVIIHTIGSVDTTMGRKAMFHINAEGTNKMLKWGKVHGCKHFIQISSVSIQGFLSQGQYKREDGYRCRYIGIPYMLSKAKAERYIEASGMNYTILRLPGVIGEEDTYLSPAIVPRLLSGTLDFASKDDKLVSVLYVKNLNLIMDRLIEHGPLNDAYNCTDHTVTWRTLVNEYAKNLNVDPGDRYKNFWMAMPAMFADKHYGLTITFSCNGCHYPNDKLTAALGQLPIKYAWQDGVREGVSRFMAKHKDEFTSNVRKLNVAS